MFGGLVGAGGLAYLDARPTAAMNLLWCQATYNL